MQVVTTIIATVPMPGSYVSQAKPWALEKYQCY